MSKKYYDMLTNFYNITVEKANDADVAFIMYSIRSAARARANTKLSGESIAFFRDFIDNFIETATEDDAIYLKEGIIALAKNVVDNPKEVEKFVERKKKENAEKK